jgi:hypothetical protein
MISPPARFPSHSKHNPPPVALVIFHHQHPITQRCGLGRCGGSVNHRPSHTTTSAKEKEMCDQKTTAIAGGLTVTSKLDDERSRSSHCCTMPNGLGWRGGSVYHTPSRTCRTSEGGCAWNQDGTTTDSERSKCHIPNAKREKR